MWCAGARQLHRLSRFTDAKFLLCLQPNLHDGAGKPLTTKEREILRTGSIYREWVIQNYAYFADAGAALRSEGIAFYDLRRLYDGVSSTVYRDECCHFSKAGNDLLAEHMAELISGEVSPRESRP